MSSRVLGTNTVLKRLATVRQGAAGLLEDRELAELLLSRIKGRFMQGVAPDGTPWPGLLEGTIAEKRRKGTKHPEQLLYETGRLYNSIKIIQGSNAGLLAGNTGLGIRIGVSDPVAAEYGRLHNYGIGQERRQFIGLSALDLVAVRGKINRKLQSIAKG